MIAPIRSPRSTARTTSLIADGDMDPIETPRLLLRPLTFDDAPRLAEIYSDAETMRYVGGKTLDLEETRAQIERQMNAQRHLGFSLFATVEKASGALIGRCGLILQYVDGRPETEIGYLIARSHWRRGFALEAARACRDWARGTRGFTRLVSLIVKENVGSIAVATKNGMTLEKDTRFKGWDVHVYASDGAAHASPRESRAR